MLHVDVQQLAGPPTHSRHSEYVERKGLGHPDSICDAVMEAISVALAGEYLNVAGRVLHHNIDKGLLVAGQTTPALGGGRVDAPMRLVVGDRATTEYEGRPIDVPAVVEATVNQWLAQHLRFVDPQRHVVLQNELRGGSLELVDIFARGRLTANDTSAAVGYAPLTESERLVLAAERYLNSPALKQRFPASGEDVKVMGVRHGRALELTVAVAFVDRYVLDQAAYFELKDAVREDLLHYLARQMSELDTLNLQINTLDDPERGAGGMYLTVLGTSAEGADGGQVGRGNRVNGLISLNRPMSTEAAAGKNPVSHVGKIYNLLSHHLAERIQASVGGVEETCVWLCSRIGRPLDQPWSASVEVVLTPGAALGDVEGLIADIIGEQLSRIDEFTARLTRGELPVC